MTEGDGRPPFSPVHPRQRSPKGAECCHDIRGQWWCSYGTELWGIDDHGLMTTGAFSDSYPHPREHVLRGRTGDVAVDNPSRSNDRSRGILTVTE